MKYAIILGDGMADYPIKKLCGKTPLSAANKPNLNALAKISEVGLCKTVPDGMKPGSDVANLSVLGYDPQIYYTGRSPLEAASIGVDLKPSDVTLRANLVTLGGNDFDSSVMEDYSAGEITTGEAKELIGYLKNFICTESVNLYAGVSYRHCLVLANGKTGAQLTPPHDFTGNPVKQYLPKGEHSGFYLEMMKKSFEALKSHPVNVKRVKEGKRPANSLWFWGEGTKPKLDPFTEKFGIKGAMISAVDLLKGIGKLTGMEVVNVKGATGNYDTDFAGKAKAAVDALKTKADFVYVHMEAPDECGHQGDLEHKIYSIEQIDKVVGAIKSGLDDTGERYALLILPDHPTPLALKTHVDDPVPYLLYKSDRKAAGAPNYDEENAKASGIYVQTGHTLIKKLLEE